MRADKTRGTELQCRSDISRSEFPARAGLNRNMIEGLAEQGFKTAKGKVYSSSAVLSMLDQAGEQLKSRAAGRSVPVFSNDFAWAIACSSFFDTVVERSKIRGTPHSGISPNHS